ncbi:MAG: YqgE/AlgH family protein [Bacteroidota bacterium]
MDGNEKIWSYEFEKDKTITAGQLLLSEPFMFDENFKRTVVLVCEHNEENGTVGLILNKPVNLKLNDVVEGFPSFNAKVFLGGPVGTDTLQFVHSLGNKIEDSVQLTTGLYWGGNFEQMKLMLETGQIQAEQIRFFLGYSGWGPDQLVQEMKVNSWIVSPGKSKYIFKADFNHLWKTVMTEMGGIYNTMAGYPENPMLN